MWVEVVQAVSLVVVVSVWEAENVRILKSWTELATTEIHTLLIVVALLCEDWRQAVKVVAPMWEDQWQAVSLKVVGQMWKASSFSSLNVVAPPLLKSWSRFS